MNEQVKMLQDITIAIYNMMNLYEEKDIEKQYDEACFVLH